MTSKNARSARYAICPCWLLSLLFLGAMSLLCKSTPAQTPLPLAQGAVAIGFVKSIQSVTLATKMQLSSAACLGTLNLSQTAETTGQNSQQPSPTLFNRWVKYSILMLPGRIIADTNALQGVLSQSSFLPLVTRQGEDRYWGLRFHSRF